MRTLLIVVNDFGFFVSHRVSLADAARAAGYDVHVAIPLPDSVPAEFAARFRFHDISLGRKSLSPLGELKTIFSLARLYRALKPDVVHHFTIKPVIYGSIVASYTRVPKVVNTVTGLGYVFIQNTPLARGVRTVVKALYKFALSSSRVTTVFQNPNDRELFLQLGIVGETNSKLIFGSGVDPEKFYVTAPPRAAAVSIVFPGRMLWDKGVGELIEAARQLKKEGFDFELRLAGGIDPGNRSAIPLETIRGWEGEGLCRWLDHVKDMPGLLRNSDIVCLPSYREGLPLALLEAAASARPIVTTRAPGCDLTVIDGETGYLVPPKNSGELARALAKLLRDAGTRETMGLKARQFVLDRYTQKIVNEQVMELYAT